MRQEMMGFGIQWHQLDHTQIICTSLQTRNHINISSLNFTGRMLFLMPNQQCQSSEGNAESDAKYNDHSLICKSQNTKQNGQQCRKKQKPITLQCENTKIQNVKLTW